jgi:hypothetical protein
MSSSPLPELPAIGFLADVDSSHREFLASFGKFLRPHDGAALTMGAKLAGSEEKSALHSFWRPTA